MNYLKNEIKQGIKVHLINTNKFKTNLIAIFLTNKLTKENVTKNAIIPLILERGTNKLRTQEEINKKLEDMYGAYFNCGIDKVSDNQIVKFYMETINDKYLYENKENLLNSAIELILDIIFNPYVKDGKFKKEYVSQEKKNLKEIIEGKIDNKSSYAFNRCIEEMYEEQPYGLYKFGNKEDLEKMDEENLYQYYKEMIDNAEIDIFIAGDLNEEVFNLVNENENIIKLTGRKNEFENRIITNRLEEKIVEEKANVVQGKLVLGLNVNSSNYDEKYVAIVYNSILGGSANSKIFQNVREKANLAYIASSTYVKNKDNIFINCGIEIENYEKALNLIKEQIESMKKGEFTQEEIEENKEIIIDNLKTVKDEQDSQITYLFGQEINKTNVSIEEYIDKISKVTKEDIEVLAKKININTVYFLRS